MAPRQTGSLGLWEQTWDCGHGDLPGGEVDREFVITGAGGTGASLGLGFVVTLNGTCLTLCRDDWVCFWEGMSGTKNPYIAIFLTPKTFFSNQVMNSFTLSLHLPVFFYVWSILDT